LIKIKTTPEATECASKKPEGILKKPKGKPRSTRGTSKVPTDIQRYARKPKGANLYLQTPDQPHNRPFCYSYWKFVLAIGVISQPPDSCMSLPSADQEGKRDGLSSNMLSVGDRERERIERERERERESREDAGTKCLCT